MKLLALIHIILLILALWRLLRKPRNPSEALSWLLFIVLSPIGGPLIFLLFSTRKANIHYIKRWMLSENFKVGRPGKYSHKRKIIYDLEKISNHAATSAVESEMISDLNLAKTKILEAISAAKERILIEYYIFERDHISDELFDLLIKKRKEGVEVFLLYDWLGSFTINRRKLRELRKAGGEAVGFAPFKYWLRLIMFNLRNHRKLILIDEEYGITGSANYGGTYLGPKHPGQNHDYVLFLRGEVCRYFAKIFCLDWKFATGRDLDHFKIKKIDYDQKHLIHLNVIESGPHIRFENLHESIISLINSAKSSIKIATPYLAPSEPVLTALKIATKRGVRVEIIIPHKTDSVLANFANASFAKELQQNQIVIYEYFPAFLHSKIMLVDHEVALLGTPNLDCRSFRLNFELSLIFSDAQIAGQVSCLFLDELLAHSDLYSKKTNKAVQLIENFSRIFAPQL